MPRCLMLAPFPLVRPRHGGQVRAASLARALSRAGWRVDTLGIYHADGFPAGERGDRDILISDPAVGRLAAADMLFGDLHVARGAANDEQAIDRLRTLLTRVQPDVVQVEHPWDWLVLRPALPAAGRPKIVYSSHNVEWRARLPLLGPELNRPDSGQLIEATRLLEREFACAADLTMSISDLETREIARETGREVAYVPPASDLAEGPGPAAFNRGVPDRSARHAALMGSHYWPNVEGFFSIFPHGLGFLTQDEQVWVAGSLGAALRADARYQDFRSVNDARLRDCGYVADADKAAFFAGAACVIVPVQIGAGARQKTADALASRRPVIATSIAIEGYGPLVHDVLDRGVYVADTPREFRGLIRHALRDGLAACPDEVRERVSPARMTETLRPLFAGLLHDSK